MYARGTPLEWRSRRGGGIWAPNPSPASASTPVLSCPILTQAYPPQPPVPTWVKTEPRLAVSPPGRSKPPTTPLSSLNEVSMQRTRSLGISVFILFLPFLSVSLPPCRMGVGLVLGHEASSGSDLVEGGHHLLPCMGLPIPTMGTMAGSTGTPQITWRRLCCWLWASRS